MQKLTTSSSNGTTKRGGGKAVLWIIFILLVVLIVTNTKDKEQGTSDAETGSQIIYVEAPNTEGAAAEEKEDEISIPIRTQYSNHGNFHSIFTQTQNAKDNFGNVHDTAYTAYISHNSCTKKLTYTLDGSYKRLEGTIYLSDQDKDNINYCNVYVYNENGDCIYKSAQITEDNLGPINVNCNISGCTKITIELEGCSTRCLGVTILMPEEGFTFIK